MSDCLRVGDAGPTVGPDELGPAGPAWTITGAGHTRRGRPWFVLRKRGGLRARITLAEAVTDEQVMRDLIDEHVRRLHPLPKETGA